MPCKCEKGAYQDNALNQSHEKSSSKTDCDDQIASATIKLATGEALQPEVPRNPIIRQERNCQMPAATIALASTGTVASFSPAMFIRLSPIM